MARERKYTPNADDKRDYPADFQTVVEGGGSPLHEHFGRWVADKTEAASYFKTQKEVTAFELGARFGIRYRMDHQAAIDGAHAFHAEQREEREAREGVKAERAATRKSAKAAPAEEAPAPKRRPGRPAKVVEPVEEEAPAPKRRGRPARAAAAETPAPKAEARPVRRPAASGAAPRPARRTGKGGTEPAF